MLTATLVSVIKDLTSKGCVYVNTVDAESICKYLIFRKIRYQVAAVGDHYRRIELV